MRKCKCNGAFPAERARAETAPEAASVSVESALCAAAVSFLFFFFLYAFPIAFIFSSINEKIAGKLRIIHRANTVRH